MGVLKLDAYAQQRVEVVVVVALRYTTFQRYLVLTTLYLLYTAII